MINLSPELCIEIDNFAAFLIGQKFDSFNLLNCRYLIFQACAVAEVEDYSKVIDLVMCMMGFSGNDKNFPTFQVSWTFCSDQAGVDEAAIKE